MKNLIVQGAIPLTVMETYGLLAEDCQFLADTGVGGSNSVTVFDLNTVRSFRFARNTIGSVGPRRVGIELPQRNSQDGCFEENTIRARSVGFGEYGAHWRFLRNHFWLYPEAKTAAAISISGLDVLFSGNDVHCEELSGGSGFGAVLTDLYAPAYYAPYVGQIRITNNTFACKLVGSNCLRLESPAPVVSENQIHAMGSGAAVRVDGVDVAPSIVKNRIAVETGAGILLDTRGKDAAVISGNHITATNGSVAIQVTSPPTPNTGQHRIVNNTISGFAQELSLDPATHPGTVTD